ncbi:MAG TPA: SagB/ThcOx family dehydrogenase [Thermomicrobiales bacterium]|jgi:SagB-type dehydrogenase family enzyme
MSEQNRNTETAWRFHNATKYARVVAAEGDDDLLMGTPPNLGPAIGEQDPAIEPFPYKIYTSLEPIPLPREPLATTVTALDALAMTGDVPGEGAVPDLATLARLCLWSNGLLKRWTSPWGREIEFRAAGCTGARYHLELYFVCGQLPGLDAGVYQYAAHDHSLRRLRAGDYRTIVAEATGDEPTVAAAPAIAVCTSTFWRNAWRYQERAYRHVYWDTGTLLANVLALAVSEQLPAKVVLGYADDQINALLDVDGEREAAVALVALGRTGDRPPAAPAVGPLDLPTRPISSREIDFPLIREVHHASALANGADAASWRATPLRHTPPPPGGSTTPLQPLGTSEIPQESIADVIQRRRSNRHYAAETPLPFPLFSTVLAQSTHGTALDALDPAAPALFAPYLIVNNVEGLAPGTYVFDRTQNAIELLDEGDKRAGAARIACGQDYASDAHVNVYAMTDLTPVLDRYGNRGYRLAQLEAALFAGRLQLAAHALRLGAVGSTSADDEVTAFFSPHAAGKSFMFVAVFGNRRRPSANETTESSRYLQPSSPSE